MGHSQSQARTGAYRVPDNGEGGDALLFVDVDGVLNSRNSVRANREAAESNAAAEARAEVRRNSLRRESSSSSSAAASPAKANPRPSNAASAPATTRSTYDEPVPFKCQLVRKIMDLTSLPDHQTRCVLSSTWRLDPRYLDRARDSLADAGVELYGCTNSFPCLTRVDEIVEFVERYNREHKRPARVRLLLLAALKIRPM